jgi:hypothetical protein
MNAIFTIVAKNYIGLAQVLEKSVRKYSEIDFFIFVADDFTQNELKGVDLPANVIIAKDVLNYNNETWNEMAFKYNLVEFCTAIKPACFKYLFSDNKYNKVIFTDPDVFFYNNPTLLFDELGHHSIMLTPHILDLQIDFKGDYPDYLFLVNGTFNLGFLALANTEKSKLFLDWWYNRLINYCFFDFEKGMATDQKWINILPSFFDNEELLISFNKGLNVAPWNYHERKVINKDGQLYIANREKETDTELLIFVHFSGYNYNAFINKDINHKNESASNFEDFNIVFEKYAMALAESNFNKFHSLKYSYNSFENGTNIISINRRIYRILLQEGKKYGNPFEVSAHSFFELLKQKKLIDYSVVTGDKLTNKNIQGFDKKIKLVNGFFIIVKNIIGIKKYSIMIRFFKRYFNEENQTFLADNKTNRKFQ